MLDSKSIEVIQEFKNAIISQRLPKVTNSNVLESNRGKKLDFEAIKSKVVEINGNEYIVGTNTMTEKSTHRNKRKWKEYEDYNGETIVDNDVVVSESEEDDDEEEEDEEDILGDLNIGEILGAINHPSDLVVHPEISRTYKSEVLSKLASELIDLIEIEQTTLNNLTNLLSVLNGEDWYYLMEENMGLPEYDHGLTNDDKTEEIKDVEKLQMIKEDDKEDDKRITRTQDDEVQDSFFKLPGALRKYEMMQSDFNDESKLKKVQNELINYLQISIQRQQEYIKNLTNLRNNIVRADRLKNQLYKWAKEMTEKGKE
ncbi:hypothetical protein CLIB1444_04S04478 [[Candida] jaroonii]|uniref:Uncharacterized protein n=1 Tax=[Candida] jaroonii TaxID=467808 RepID=A0ACA9Y6P9_9ASCO|nr:hypothetical protein CLIB1444_04S04478 [[Candida] jaroonii]